MKNWSLPGPAGDAIRGASVRIDDGLGRDGCGVGARVIVGELEMGAVAVHRVIARAAVDPVGAVAAAGLGGDEEWSAVRV